MSDVWLFPYLSVYRRSIVGPCTIIPRREFCETDATGPKVADTVRGLLEMYRMPRADNLVRNAYGCIVVPTEGKVGDPLDRAWFTPLHTAVVAAVLDQNPRVQKPYMGHSVTTSDNALLFGHPISDDGGVAVEYGIMSRLLVGGYHAGVDKDVIEPPHELQLPLFAAEMDSEYADSIFAILSRDDADSRRLGRAIEWLDLVWRNTASVLADVRIVAARAGFEVLLGVGEDYKAGSKALSRLLDTPDARATRHEYKTRKGKPKADAFTEFEWWFTQFCFLRNKIVHGNPIPDAEYYLDGDHHLMLAERRLREAIKRTVAAVGFPDVVIDPSKRRLRRAIADALREHGPRSPPQPNAGDVKP